MFGEPRADRFQRTTRVEVVLMDKEQEEDFYDCPSDWDCVYASDSRWASLLDLEDEMKDYSDYYPDDSYFESVLRSDSFRDELRDHPVQFLY